MTAIGPIEKQPAGPVARDAAQPTRQGDAPAPRELDRVQRRTLVLLMAGEVLGGVALTVGFAVVGILAADLAGSTGAVGLTQASQTLGAAVASYAIGAWMHRRGRRRGLATGYLVGALGAGLCALAATTGIFALLVAGSVALGSASASGSLSRYASTDLAAPERRATALSLVVWTGTAGAVAGPLLVPVMGRGADAVGLVPLAGPFLFAMVSTAAAGALLGLLLRPDPLLVARATGRTAPPAATGADASVATRLRPLAPVIAALVLAHTTMVVVMVMTPVAMHQGGASHHAIGAAISLHFLGMFAFAPVSGLLADRLGAPRALAGGAAVLLTALALLAGVVGDGSAAHGAGMFTIGLGWSVCTVAASAHLAAASAGDTRVQGIAETTMAFVSAGAAAACGPVMALWGFRGLVVVALLVVVAMAGCASRIRPLSTAGVSVAAAPS